jgi:carbon storage regulator CsrA
MLVLSRRAGDKILFPDLNISVGILQTNGRNVRVGIEAPPDVAVLRHELAAEPSRRSSASAAKKFSDHDVRNRLNIARLGMHLMEQQLKSGDAGAALSTMGRAIKALDEIEATIKHGSGGPGSDKPADRPPKMRALLVEDDPNESELLAGILRMSGIAVDTAGDGCQALDYLAHHARPDVVLLDMKMPRFSGPATVSAIRSDPHLQGLKVFAVSGSTAAEEGMTLGPSGVDRWFSKPLDPGRLLREMKHDLAVMHTSA